MTAPTSSMIDFARRLLASGQNPSEPHVHGVVVAIENLRILLTRLAGTDGFVSLLRRALALARTGEPSLRSVQVGPDGRLLGFEQVAIDSRTAGADEALAIVAQLFTLMSCFIGEPLTRSLLREAWPNVPLDNITETDR